MGQELVCKMRYRQQMLAGKAQLETDFLLFRGEERLKVFFKDLTGAAAAGGVLTLEFPGGPAEFELGPAAARWVDKIRNPPTRLDKLGVKPGLVVRLVGDFEAAFLVELSERQATRADGKGKVDLVFLAAGTADHLGRIGKLASGMRPDGALWVIYPKGVAAIREIEVIQAGREAGLKDVKVARFSQTHTALKFVVPLAAR